jgi:dTDP-4-dehydrorhamnose reductase
MPTILLFGAGGQLGWELERTLAPLGEVRALRRSEVELTDLDGVREVVGALRPAVVVNAAAYTAVDRAEAEPELAWRINAGAPGVMAEEAARCGAVMVHYSTDYVFDGRAGRAYREDDEPAPLNVYGASKLGGERAVAAAGGAHLVFRTSWVYGVRGSNFLRTMLRLARERDSLRVVDDQRAVPTWSRGIAEATALVLARAGAEGRFALPADGLFHLVAQGEASWHEFAQAIFEMAPEHLPDVRQVRVEPIDTATFGAPAARPGHSLLAADRLAAAYGLRLPHWREQLRQVLMDIAAT